VAEITDPSTSTAQANAQKINEIIEALKGAGLMT
jgi:hypothetical protein